MPGPSTTAASTVQERTGLTLQRMDGKRVHERALPQAPTGRCGLWSKADSKVLLDDFDAAP